MSWERLVFVHHEETGRVIVSTNDLLGGTMCEGEGEGVLIADRMCEGEGERALIVDRLCEGEGVLIADRMFRALI